MQRWRDELDARGYRVADNLARFRAALAAVRSEVALRMSESQDVRPPLDNARTEPEMWWMLDPRQIHLTGLLTLNEPDHNAFASRLIMLSRGGPGTTERLEYERVLNDYTTKACAIRDEVVSAAMTERNRVEGIVARGRRPDAGFLCSVGPLS